MGINGLCIILVDLLLVQIQEVKSDIIGVTLNRVSEELNLEGGLRSVHVLYGKPKPPAQDEDFDDLLGLHKLLVMLEKFQNVIVAENHF